MTTTPLYDLPVDYPDPSTESFRRTVLVMMLGGLSAVVIVALVASVVMGTILANVVSSLPDAAMLENFHPSQSTQIFDRKRTLIANVHGDEDRVVVPLSDISPNIQRAVLAIEDNRFYQHSGVDIRGTVRATFQNARGSEVQGGSTITQQLVKNLFLTPERSISRKIAEALLALRVEQFYPKDKIMEMYLNQVYWGNQAYGIEKAARRYFRKPAKDLTIGESALLAGLLKAPEGLSPYAYPQAAEKRQREVLAKMEEYGYITHTQRQQAQAEVITLNKRQVKPSRHPFFVTYVIEELKEKFGEDVVRRGGLKVYTTLDEEIQSAAEKALVDKVKSLPAYTNVNQGALVSLDIQTGEVMAMVGGVDFEKSQFNNATQGHRAAGSSFKPFVYLTGLRLGKITPETPISDKPVCFHTGISNWCPKNWDGKYFGAMNIRKALTLSRNTPTVQIGMKVGIDNVIETARLAGITSPIDRNFSSLLGSSGFTPLEMATAYSTFARYGIRIKPTAIELVEDTRGRSVPFNASKPKRTLEARPISQLVSILIDVVEKGTGKNARLEGRQVAGKTGTTDKVRDIWFTGFTPDMVTCVWMGNQRYVPLRGVFSSDAASVWHNFAESYYKIKPVEPTKFLPPALTDKDGKVDYGVLNEGNGEETDETTAGSSGVTSSDSATAGNGHSTHGEATSGNSTANPEANEAAGSNGETPPNSDKQATPIDPVAAPSLQPLPTQPASSAGSGAATQ